MNVGLDPSPAIIGQIANGIITFFIALMLLLGLLITRQARQMTQVLPSPVSPFVKALAYVYTLLALGALIIALGTFITI